MAETDTPAGRDTLPDPAVSPAETPLVEITFHDTTQGFVVLDESKPPVEIEPGKGYLVPATIAIANLQSGHAAITGSETPAATEKRIAKMAKTTETKGSK